MAKGAMGRDPGKRMPAGKVERRSDLSNGVHLLTDGIPLANIPGVNGNAQGFTRLQQGPQTDPGFMIDPNDPRNQELANIAQRLTSSRPTAYQPPPQQNVPSINPQDIYGYSSTIPSPDRMLASPARNSFMQQNPAYRPYENPPPGQAPQQGMQNAMLGQGIQQAIQSMGQSMPVPQQLVPQQLVPQQPAPSYLGGNQNRVRQSEGVYKDPATGALYNSKNQMIRRGR